MREKIRRLVLPVSNFEPEPPDAALMEHLISTFERDQLALRELAGDDAPAWDLSIHRDTVEAAASAQPTQSR